MSAALNRFHAPGDDRYRLDLKGKKPLYAQLKELIKHQIADQVWKLDEMIPSENELSAAYGISVGTVKKALSVLVEEGVLYRRQGKGTYVDRPDFGKSFIRFFRYGHGDGMEGRFPSSSVLNSKIIRPPSRVRQFLKLTGTDSVIAIRRVRTLENLPVMLEDLYLPEKIFKGFDRIDISQELLYPIYDIKYNSPIIWADEYLWSETAGKKTADVLEIKPGAPVICIERIAHTHGNHPVEFRYSVGRGDRFWYHIELR